MQKLISGGKIILILFLAFFVAFQAHSQIASGRATVKKYNDSQKRLLIVNTGEFINLLTQNILDQDSVRQMACRITGLQFLLPYNDLFPRMTPTSGTNLINSGKIQSAERLLASQQGESRIQLLLELGIWYLHKPGATRGDLARSRYYAQNALTLSSVGNYKNWRNACLDVFAEYAYQSGDTAGCKRTFQKLIAFAQYDKNTELVARTWQHFGQLLPLSDTTKLVYLKRSLQLYRQLKNREKIIELLWNVAGCNIQFEPVSMENDLRQILSLQQLTGFQHSMYAKSMLAYVLLRQGKFLKGLDFANAALENMKWSEINTFSANFYMRVGNAYSAMNKYPEALELYKKGLENRTGDTQLFWFNNLVNAAYCLMRTNKPKEELVIIDQTIKKFPPVTKAQLAQVCMLRGNCYEHLNMPVQADESYTQLFKLTKDDQRTLLLLNDDFTRIALYYMSRGNFQKGGMFAQSVLRNGRKDAYGYYNRYVLSYKLDSAAGNYRSALINYMGYKFYNDSLTSADQGTKLEGLKLKYGAEKKDQSIKLLKQQKATQQAELERNKLTRNIYIAGTALLIFIVMLLLNQFRLKQRSNRAINKKNAELQHLLNEKEWLLKEIHHRVKNNLHTVICLLESQAAYLEDDALKAIENSQHRIYAMSLIHQKLYQSDNVKTINMSLYLSEFIQYLSESFGVQRHIRFQLNIGTVVLGLSQAIPLALIVNEAVTNAFKYAFPDQRKGIVEISLLQEKSKITLVIADNGIGIDPVIAKHSSKSLGLKLIRGLSEDIYGEVDIVNELGTRIAVTFFIDQLSGASAPFSSVKETQLFG